MTTRELLFLLNASFSLILSCFCSRPKLSSSPAGDLNLNVVAMALSGYTDEKASLWREMCSSLRLQLKNPYLCIMFAFLTSEPGAYDAVLVLILTYVLLSFGFLDCLVTSFSSPSLRTRFCRSVSVREQHCCERQSRLRLHVPQRRSGEFTPQTVSLSSIRASRSGKRSLSGESLQLPRYIEKLTAEMKDAGNLEGLLLTGLTKDGVDLMESYVDITGDVQTASFCMLKVSPREIKAQ